jgi:predicted nucleic acid-binding protein
LRVFLDTSVLSDESRGGTRAALLTASETGLELYVSSISHFQILWGYAIAKMSAANYHKFLEIARVGIAPIIKADAEEAARMKSSKADLLDALIASSAKRYGAVVWTADKDFLKFLPKSKVRMM